jgi:hypothetical protein
MFTVDPGGVGDFAVSPHSPASDSARAYVARGEDRPDSDIDFLVEFESGTSLFDLLRLEDDRRELLGRRVDFVSAGAFSGLLMSVPMALFAVSSAMLVSNWITSNY